MNATTGLLEQAITYAARSVLDVTPALLPRPTPCRGWNLDMLLTHASESLAALHDGTVTGHIALIPAAPHPASAADPTQTFRDRAGQLLAARATSAQSAPAQAAPARAAPARAAPARATPAQAAPAQATAARAGAPHASAAGRRQALDIGDLPLPAIAMECAGAIEITVHGWDISQACGQRRPIPHALAASLLAIAPLLIPDTGRHPLFGPPITPPAHASPGDRLIAYLGRKPSTSRLGPDSSLPFGSN